MYTCDYMYVYVYELSVYMCMCICRAGNRRFRIAKCESLLSDYESLWQSESQNCESFLAVLPINFQMVSQNDFFCPHSFLDKISPF